MSPKREKMSSRSSSRVTLGQGTGGVGGLGGVEEGAPAAVAAAAAHLLSLHTKRTFSGGVMSAEGRSPTWGAGQGQVQTRVRRVQWSTPGTPQPSHHLEDDGPVMRLALCDGLRQRRVVLCAKATWTVGQEGGDSILDPSDSGEYL
jgi:hypothetical protein